MSQRFLIAFILLFVSACSQNYNDMQSAGSAIGQDVETVEDLASDNSLALDATSQVTEEEKILTSYSVEKNYILAEIDKDFQYELDRTAPSEYVIRLHGVALADALEPTVLMPEGDIRSARFDRDGSDLNLHIFTNPAVMLQAEETAAGKLLVSSVFNEDIKLEEIRAQAEEESEAKLAEELEGAFEEKSGLFDDKYSGRLISLDLQDTDIDNALRIIAEVSNLNIIASDDVSGKVTLRLQDVPWDQALDVILKTNGLDMVREGNVVRIAPLEKLRAEREALKQAKQAEEELEALKVQYVRISYAKASELQSMVESVLTERGNVTYDERTNQLIIKDITRGLENALKLVEKLDLRTPQVLIESQIVEATRTFTRRLGSQLGFTFLRTPTLGNALPYNFPNSAEIAGSGLDSNGQATNNIVNQPNGEQNAISFLFGSSDGAKSLDLRLSQAESEGIARVISRPSVAVTNNTPAEIKSVQKIRIRLPQGGGINIGVGSGSSGSGGGNVATETIEVGIVLNVTAQASPDYFVLMDIEAKSSTLGNIADAVDNIPPEIERTATSSVLVSSGQTFAMGGIYRVDENNDIAGLPFFKDIPVLGHFFRSSTVIDTDQELLFFLTPRIIEGSFDDAALQKS